MTDELELKIQSEIYRAREIIKLRASMMRLNYDVVDIVDVRDPDSGATFIWLRKHSPELIENENGISSIQYQHPIEIHFIHEIKPGDYVESLADIHVHILSPWLVFKVDRDGVLVGDLSDIGNADFVRSFSDGV